MSTCVSYEYNDSSVTARSRPSTGFRLRVGRASERPDVEMLSRIGPRRSEYGRERGCRPQRGPLTFDNRKWFTTVVRGERADVEDLARLEFLRVGG